MEATLTDNVTDKIAQILWGKSFADVADESGIEHTFVLRSLSSRENNYLNFIYDKQMRLSQEAGILTQDQLRRLLYAQGVWTEEDVKEREDLLSELKLASNQLKTSEFNTVRKKTLKKRINTIEERVKQINQQEVSLFAASAENRAEEYRRRLMVAMFTETELEEPVWSSVDEFMQCDDLALVVNLVKAYYINNIYTEKELRRIARHAEWRFRWMAAKHGEGLYGRPIAEWSEMQNMLVYWSEYYDGIYESMERPADYIIEDDVACDAWVADQNKKAAQSRGAQNKKTASKTMDHAEQFVMVAKDDQEAIKKVHEMNPDRVRSQLRDEFEQVKKSDSRVKEWQLGGRKDSTPINFKRKGKK